MESLIPVSLLGLASLGLILAAWPCLLRGHVYGALLGALGLYGFSTLASIGELRMEFGPAMVDTAGYVFFFGSVALGFALATFEMLLPRSGPTPIETWASRFAISATTHSNLALLLAIASVTVFILVRPDIALTWSDARSDNGILISCATFLLMLAFPGVVSALIARRWSTAVAVTSTCMVAFLLSGSRAAALGAVAMFAWVVVCRPMTRARKVSLALTLGVIAFLIHTLLRFARGMGLVGIYSALQEGTLFELFRSSAASSDVSGGEASIARYLVFAVQSASADVYGYMTTIARLCLLFVPGSLTTFEKPLDVTYRLWAAGFESGMFSGAEGAQVLQDSFISGNFGSLHATLFGELFLSGGWGSLIFSCLIIGGVLVLIDRWIVRVGSLSGLLLIGPTLVGQLMIARGNTVIGIGYFAYLILPSVIVAKSAPVAWRISRSRAGSRAHPNSP